MTPAPISLPKGYVLDSGSQSPQLPAGYTLDSPKPAAAGPQEPGNHFGDIIGDAIKNGPTRFMNFITGHPIEDLNKNAEAHGEAAKAAIKAGDWSTAFGHLLAGLLPGIGDEAVKAGEEFGSGNPSGGFGHAVLALAPILGPEALERAGPYVEAAGKGVAAAAPDAASGLAKIGTGEVIAKIPGLELPARFGLQYPGLRQIRGAIPKGWDAFKTALDAAKAKAEPVGTPAIPPQASTPVETPSTPVEAMAQKGAAVQFTPAEEALAQHIMQSTEPQSISSALNLPASAAPRTPLQPPLAGTAASSPVPSANGIPANLIDYIRAIENRKPPPLSPSDAALMQKVQSGLAAQPQPSPVQAPISLAEALRQEMLRSGTLDASKEAAATESSAQAPVPQGPLDAGFRSLPASVRKTAADANYRAQQETGAGVPAGQAYEAAARANKVDPLVDHLSTKLQENGISADDAAILKNPQFKPHWATLSHDLGIKPPSSTTITAVIEELKKREATAK